MSKFVAGLGAAVLALIALPVFAQTLSSPAGCVAGVPCAGRSMTINGATLGSNALAVNGSTSFTGAQNVFTNPIWVGNGVVSGCQDPTGPNGDGVIFCANTVNNMMELQQLGQTTYSAIGFENYLGSEQAATGVGNPSALAIFANDFYQELNNATPINWSIIAGDTCGRDLDVVGNTGEVRLFTCSGSQMIAYGTQVFSIARATGNIWSSGSLALGATAAASSPNLLQLTPPNDDTALSVSGSTITSTNPLVNIATTFNGAHNTEAFNLVITDTSHGTGAAAMRITGGSGANVNLFSLDMTGDGVFGGTLAGPTFLPGSGGVTETVNGVGIGWQSRSYMVSSCDGCWGWRNNATTATDTIYTAANNDFQLGGAGSATPAAQTVTGQPSRSC